MTEWFSEKPIDSFCKSPPDRLLREVYPQHKWFKGHLSMGRMLIVAAVVVAVLI